MGSNCTIKEGAVSRAITASKLKTVKQGEGSCIFVPKNDVALGTKYINENGIYRPADDGKYGFSQFTAAVTNSGSVTGRGQDGKIHRVSVNPSGDLNDEVLQISIAVVKLPDLVLYSDGGTIDFTGIEVHAYDSEGGDLGEIAFEELVFPVTVATYDESTASPESATSGYDTGPIEKPFPFESEITVEWNDGDQSVFSLDNADGRCTAWIYDSTHAYIVLASDNQNAEYGGARLTNWIAYGDKTVYYWAGTVARVSHSVASVSPNAHKGGYASASVAQIQNIAWTMFYGEILSGVSTQEIPVQWERPSDGEILGTLFTIGVTRTSGGGKVSINSTGRID